MAVTPATAHLVIVPNIRFDFCARNGVHAFRYIKSPEYVHRVNADAIVS